MIDLWAGQIDADPQPEIVPNPAGGRDVYFWLQANPDEILPRLYDLARDNSSLLIYLPGLAHDAGEPVLADLGEGLNLLAVRPELTGQDLRTVTSQ